MAECIDLAPEFAAAWEGRDPFEAVSEIEGEVFRKVKSRKTFRFELFGNGYFAKIHHGVGWREIVKNWLMCKRPVLGARNEYNALRLLHRIGVDTMRVCAYGWRGWNPARIESFLITAELKGMRSLEVFCRNWMETRPQPRLRHALNRKLAMTVKRMHDAGLNHRDCYLCHFLLDRADCPGEFPRLYVIDLHRAEIRKKVPCRYRVKDVAGIYFSAMEIGLTRNDRFRFMKLYSGKTLRTTLREDARFWSSVKSAATKLYGKERRRREQARPVPLSEQESFSR